MSNLYIITGASDGLGLATAKKLLGRDSEARIISLSRKKPEDSRIDHIPFDLTDPSSIKSTTDRLLEITAPITTIINCAGVMSKFDLTDTKEFSDIVHVYSVNVMGVIYFTNLLLDKIKHDKTDIINISSTAGTKGSASEPVYGSSKWAIRGYTKCLQEYFKGTDNRIVSFCPGGMQGKMREKITGEILPDPENWMPLEDMADNLLNIVLSPKSTEFSEVIINRKSSR